MSNVSLNFHPFDETTLNKSIKRLAFLFASDMDWIAKIDRDSKNSNSKLTEINKESKQNE